MADRKIAAMHKVYGMLPCKTCADCSNLDCYLMRSGRRYYKCRAYGNSSSEATDWAKKWVACCLWCKRLEVGHVPLIEMLKHSKKAESKPIEGQIDMFGGVVE